MRFLPATSFVPAAPGYRILPLRFMRWSADEVLLTNEVGEFIFLDRHEFTAFVEHRLSPDTPPYRALKARHLLADGSSDIPIELLATKVRTKRDFLTGFTRLHLFVVTLRCDHSCPYCQVSRVTQDRSRFDMSQETAARSLDLMFRSPAPSLKMEFQGGESLLNFDLIRWLVLRAEERNRTERRDLQFVIATKPITREADIQIMYDLTWFSSVTDVNREVNNGRGPVDFKISRGSIDASLVEFKLASNSKLKANLAKQVAIYQKAGRAPDALKVVTYFTDAEGMRLDRILKELTLESDPNVIVIDARADNKPSASKA
jgi:hypothetical protein